MSLKCEWKRLHTPKGVAELHGDQLYGWFKEHSPKHPKALNRIECRKMFTFAIDQVLSHPEHLKARLRRSCSF